MSLIMGLIYGIIGLVIGLMIPKFSKNIMVYKKGKESIKIQDGFINYFIIVLNSVLWLVIGYYLNDKLTSVLIAIQISLAIIIAHIDINIRIIPNELVLTVLIVGIIHQIINYGLYGIIGSVMSMVFIMIVFTAVAGFMGFGKVGAGDVKLAGAIGFSSGYPLVITAMGSMAIILFVFIIIGLLLKKIKMSTMLPLGPFLSAGYLIALLSLIS